MLNLTRRQQTVLAVVAMLIMALTRSHHVAGLSWLPDASTALFFLAGVYLGPLAWFALLCGEAALVDYAAITWGGVSGYCITPAYGFLFVAYGAAWFAGRWYARRLSLNANGLRALLAAVLVGGVAAEIISSGSFYLFSGYQSSPTLAGFGANLMAFLPYSMQSLLLYVGLTALVHVAIATVTRSRHGQHAA